jgi:beta-lactam-binding protein with PASTA domain
VAAVLEGELEASIPDVAGMEAGQACRTIDETGHAAQVSDAEQEADAEPGRVIGQDPEADSEPRAQSVVNLTVSGPCNEKDLKPDTTCVTDNETRLR